MMMRGKLELFSISFLITVMAMVLSLRGEGEANRKEAAPSKEEAELVRKYSKRSENSPEVSSISCVAPDVICLTIDAQKVILPKLEPYTAKPGDKKTIEKWADGTVRRAKLVRDGKEIGWLQGKALDQFSTFESIEGDPLLYFRAEKPDNYTITSKEDSEYFADTHPTVIYRKSIPTDWQVQMNNYPMRHRLYLKLKKALSPGKSYKVTITGLNVKNPEIEFIYDSRKLQSEAVHVSQIGYRSDDPGKRAFLSVWLGSGGALSYPEGLKFSVIDEVSGKDVFTGSVEVVLTPDQNEKSLSSGSPRNSSKTAVYKMDYAKVTEPGRYRVHVEGIGCSYPFDIAANVWEKAFQIQMRGLFHNRSGVELGEPYTTFKKPRDFHPADGAVVTRSTYDVLTKGGEAWGDLVKGDTGEAIPEAWGGYHDAGDWNPRRVSHMASTMAQLELMELYPAYFNSLKLNIPPIEGIPDIMTEALFEIDCFRRLQLPDGGIPYGIETNGDPSPGELSWLSTMHAYVLAPNMRDTWNYAGVAARAAKILKPLKPELAAVYEESAKKAFAWAESDYAKRKADGSVNTIQELWRAKDNRNFAALILYDLTGERSYHEVFRQDTCMNEVSVEPCWYAKWMQSDAVFYYARLDDSKADNALKHKAISGTLKQAGKCLAYEAGNAFNLSHEDPSRPFMGSFFSTSGGSQLVRAHFLTGKEEYLTGAVRSCQFQSGCNPNNIVYTTGLGANPIKHPLHLDSRSSGQLPPDGLTSFGNVDYWNWKGGFWDWPIPFISKPQVCYPNPYEWPLAEAYFDIHLFVSMNEYVIDSWAPNILVWGYLAARPPMK
ncbi:MAG: hypothetical protein B9S32_09125 [Verrucomicrobia bacterium Tous-C9LFEB]|nr:MAG: hypothetical protein B9S32_09125 [Verrucomicrobia bacterium Tous-C9LFEB]